MNQFKTELVNYEIEFIHFVLHKLNFELVNVKCELAQH